ncbi:phosphoglycerate dehydrogenase [Lederbergia citrea]|uniref:D-3-phosphoglycerate dehydrogenase n=1 Tax=Lederbergia citrea TaxID=2833581 RepID=A0A942Z6Q9_9BACI|nr:phosphoglycerate dehydrogenase [Lederbergia citrea]MBS4179335.1 phosphoglycerate dehydrogenase [Lederbergia citrea]MBS4206004.1 phosphoglycerate dehydrogenase [Lederbergia citrea]MBS4224547.1 phosphoglycerate dehydrogenase [Lederbergia citrea]
MYKVLVAEAISDTGLKALYDHPNFTVDKIPGLTPEDLKKLIPEYDALIVRSATQVTEDILENANRMRVVARAGVGVDNIDVNAATKKGIIVINAPGANTISAAELTMAMMLSLARSIPQAHASTSEGKWERSKFKGVELYEKTLGVVGMGKIGTGVAKRAKSFGMNILGYDPYLTEERADQLGITKATLDEIARKADFITIHTPLIKETRGIINDEYFAKTKQGVRIINCARGGIIDEAALVRALNSGQVAGAALDVFETEPSTNFELLSHPNVIVTPHLGASTVEAQEKVANEVSEEIIDIFETQSIRHAVNMPQISGETHKKLQPYITVGEQMGELAIQLLKEAPDRVEINYFGELAKEDTDLLTRTMVKGVLSHHLGESVNLINAHHLLKDQGVTSNVAKTPKSKGFASYVELTLFRGEAKTNIGATVLNGYGARIVKINDYSIDVRPENFMLYITHHDIPGMIGRVGTTLGSFDINIGTMQVGRAGVGGDAIMVLTLDKTADQDVINALTELPGLDAAQFLELNGNIPVYN